MKKNILEIAHQVRRTHAATERANQHMRELHEMLRTLLGERAADMGMGDDPDIQAAIVPKNPK